MRLISLVCALLLPAVVSAQSTTKKPSSQQRRSPSASTRRSTSAAPSRRAPAKPAPKAAPKPAPTPAPPPADSASVGEGGGGDSALVPDASTLAVERRTTLRRAPDGAALAVLDSSTHVTTVARERGWVKVRVEGWVRAAELTTTDTSVLTTISAADLRAEPERYRGQTVRWQVQKIAYQTADPLRRGLAPDEPYLLARGPGDENSLLYLALPPSLVEQARRIEPLAEITVTARVRSGKSEPSGVPLLDVESIVQH
jgi:hypothetical protein